MKTMLRVAMLLIGIVCFIASPALAKTPDDTDPLTQEGGPVDFGSGGSGSNRENCWQCIDNVLACRANCTWQPDPGPCVRMCEAILARCSERYGC